MDFKQVLTGLLSTAYKQDGGELIALLQSDTIDLTQEELSKKIVELDSKRIASLTEKSTNNFQDGYKKGKSESLSELEKTLKSTYADVKDSELKGIDLISDIVSKHSVKKEVTDNDVLLSPLYQNTERRLREEKEAAVKAVQDEFSTFKNNVGRQKTFETVEAKLFSARERLGAIIPASNDRALKTEQNLRRDLEDYDFQVQDNGGIVILKDNKVLQDAHGNTVDFDSFAQQRISDYYDFKQNAGGNNPPAGGEQGAGANNVPKVTTTDDYFAYINDSKVSYEDKVAFAEKNKDIVE